MEMELEVSFGYFEELNNMCQQCLRIDNAQLQMVSTQSISGELWAIVYGQRSSILPYSSVLGFKMGYPVVPKNIY